MFTISNDKRQWTRQGDANRAAKAQAKRRRCVVRVYDGTTYSHSFSVDRVGNGPTPNGCGSMRQLVAFVEPAATQLVIDIDPTCQDWAEPGHYDYDEVYEALAAAIRSAYPEAEITREKYRHDCHSRILVVRGPTDAVDYVFADVTGCTWIAD